MFLGRKSRNRRSPALLGPGRPSRRHTVAHIPDFSCEHVRSGCLGAGCSEGGEISSITLWSCEIEEVG